MSRAEMAPLLANISTLTFGTEEDGAGIRTAREAARPLGQLYTWNASERTFLNNQTGELYIANDEIGFFVPENGGEPITPGYRTSIGF